MLYTNEYFLKASRQYILKSDPSLKDGPEDGGYKLEYNGNRGLGIRVVCRPNRKIKISIYYRPKIQNIAENWEKTTNQLSTEIFTCQRNTLWMCETRQLISEQEDVKWTVEQIKHLKDIIDALTNNAELPQELLKQEDDKYVTPSKDRTHSKEGNTKALEGPNSYLQADAKGDSTRKGTSGKRNNPDKNEKHQEIPFDPYGKELTENDLKLSFFNVSEYCKKIRDFGNQPLEVDFNGTIYWYVRTADAKENIKYKFAEKDDARREKAVKIYDVSSWPMTKSLLPPEGMPDNMPFDPKNPTHATDDICKISDPKFNPLVIYIGMNFSETSSVIKEKNRPAWKNGYNEQANVVLDSILSGGYFTDFIKCYPKTKMTTEDWKIIHTQGPDTLPGVTWYNLYVEFLKKELRNIKKIFSLDGRFKIIVWGKTLYDNLNKHKHNFYNDFAELGDIYIAGLHYCKTATAVFPDDAQDKNKKDKSSSKLKSCRRIYNAKNILEMSEDRSSKGHDLRRYDFALLEDEEGHLHAYKGNPVAK